MMSRTHYAIGMATALAILPTHTPIDCAVVLAGGAIGGVLADVDILNDDYKHDALIGELLAFGTVGCTILLDFLFGKQYITSVLTSSTLSIIGLLGFAVLWVVGFITDHRTFTHSVLAMLLFSFSLALIQFRFGIACLAGYASHLVLDLLNKKGMQLLFPLRYRMCLKLFYADKTANTVFMILGFVVTIALLFFKIVIVKMI